MKYSNALRGAFTLLRSGMTKFLFFYRKFVSFFSLVGVMGSVFIPYVATSLSVISRFVFMLMIYRNKSTKSLSLVMCALSISSSCMWISYSIENNDVPLIVRSSLEIPLQTISAMYIIRNKMIQYYSEKKISSIPTPHPPFR